MPLARAFSGTGSDADFAPKKKVPAGITEAQEKIKHDITTNDVFLYMKGVPTAPQCGFSNQVCMLSAVCSLLRPLLSAQGSLLSALLSALCSPGFSDQVCRVLDHLGVEYGSRNILEEADIREGVKVFSNWPTLPQLYVKGEFVGGCDIIVEMFREGELTALMEEHKIKLNIKKD
jgi:monothiol glutaredoxin